LSILCYLNNVTSLYRDKAQSSRRTPYADTALGVYGVLGSRWYWLSLATFILAILSKGSVAVLPVLLLGIVWWLRHLTRRDLVQSVPFFVVAVVLAGVNIWFQTHGTELVIRSAGYAERLLGAGCVVWFYLYKALLPVDLIFVYPQWQIEPGNLLWWIPLAAALSLTAVLWRFRESWSRPLLFAWGFFCIALVPVMGFSDVGFMQYSLVADHYQHIAIIGVIALVSALWAFWREREASHSSALVVAIVATGTLALLTWQQSWLYRDPMTLYQITLGKNPGCSILHNNLGSLLVKNDQPKEAIKHFQQALALKSDYPEAHNNLGNTLFDSGQVPEAIDHFQQALRLNSDYPDAHYNLGIALVQAGRLQEAIKHYEKALELKPNYYAACDNLGNVLLKTGRPQEAIKYYKRAILLKPDYVTPYNNLGTALKETGQYQQAVEYYKKALQLKPAFFEAQYNLGVALVQMGRYQEAIESARQAILLKPDYAEAHYILALAYAGMHQSSEVIDSAQKAIELARSQGQITLAMQIEDWLKSNRNGRSN
jgi:protein O-mannosyl-transferase